MPNKTDLHERIERLTKELTTERESHTITQNDLDASKRYAEAGFAAICNALTIAQDAKLPTILTVINAAQAKADKLFEESKNLACISVGLIRYVLEDMIEQLPTDPNRYDLHKWASTIAQELMADQAKGARIEVDTLFIEPADLRIEYPTGDHDA